MGKMYSVAWYVDSELRSDKMRGRCCVVRGGRNLLCRGDLGAAAWMGRRNRNLRVCLESVSVEKSLDV